MGTSSSVSILLIGINYAPELTGIGPYTTELAEHFAGQGHLVRVVTGVPHYPEWRRGRAPYSDSSNPRVSRHWHFVPRKPSAFGRMLYEASWLISGTRALTARRPQVVIGVIPSLSGGVLAWLAGRKFRVPVGLIFQDLMGEAAAQSGYRGGRRVAGLTRSTEAFVARKADLVAIISEGFRGYLETAGVPTSRVQKVRNWARVVPSMESWDGTRTRLGWAPTDFVCLHAGNMGQKQGLDNLLEAADLLQEHDIRIVLAGDGNDRNRLIDRAKHLQLRNVSFLGLQSIGEFDAMLRAANVLIVNQRPIVGDMALPSKLTSYLFSGRPIVAAVGIASNAAAELAAAGAAVVVPPGQPAALAGAIRELKTSPGLAEHLGARGTAYAQRHLTRQAALAVFDVFLRDLMNGGGPKGVEPLIHK